MNPFWTLLSLGALIGFVLSCFLFGIIWGIRAVLRLLKPMVLLDDEEGGMSYLGRAKMADGHIVVGKGDTEKRYPIRVEARSMTTMGPLYKIGRQTGAILRVPRKEAIRAAIGQKVGAGMQLVYDVVDPGLLGRTWVGRVAQETIDNQTQKDDWKKTAILPLSIVAGIAIVGLVIAVAVVGGQ